MEFSGAGKYDNRNLSIAENAKLVCLFEETVASLRVRYLPVGRVLYPLDPDLPSRHFSFSLSTFSLYSNLRILVSIFLCPLHKINENEERNGVRIKGGNEEASICQKWKCKSSVRRKGGLSSDETGLDGRLVVTVCLGVRSGRTTE